MPLPARTRPEPSRALRTANDPQIVDPETSYEELRAAIAPARARLLAHPLYDAVDDLPRLRRFMGFHVYAVWDFMCLAKRLQRELTSVVPLWRPPRHPALARFINGVILGEESDLGPDGEPISHCELYLGAMDEVGADTSRARRYLALIGDDAAAPDAMAVAGVPLAARAFMRHTLATALDGDAVEVLASFLFGREDLIPEMFARLLPRWRDAGSARRFTYYVERHIELDGDDHGPAARRALIELAGTSAPAWARAAQAAQGAIAARIALWDQVLAELG
ncbi:MAG: DUF3050 domain-containing protein [Kofleriaceae bacterium]